MVSGKSEKAEAWMYIGGKEMTDIGELNFHDLQPSQFYISEKKLHDIRE